MLVSWTGFPKAAGLRTWIRIRKRWCCHGATHFSGAAAGKSTVNAVWLKLKCILTTIKNVGRYLDGTSFITNRLVIKL